MSFDYDFLQARQISFIIYVHGYVRTAASNKHTVALKTHQILVHPLSTSHIIAISKD